MKKIMLCLIPLLLLLIVTGCDKKQSNENAFVPVTDLVVSDNFNWNTAQNVQINLEAYNNVNQPIDKMYFQIYDKSPQDAGAQILYKGLTDATGKLNTTISLPTRIKKVTVVGYWLTLDVNIENGTIHHIYGGSAAHVKQGIFAPPRGNKSYQFLPGFTFDSEGVPSIPPMLFETESPEFIQSVTNAFPEGQNLTISHPEYFQNNPMTLLKVDQPADVWITFLHENAAYHNVFGFFVYDQNAVINSVDDFGPLTVIFPNSSLSGSGGGLNSGDKIHIGTIPGGKYVGYFILADGWQSGSTFGNGYGRYFSVNNFNPEPDNNLNQHIVQVWSQEYQKIVIGMEDINRTPGAGSDNDFNDIIFNVEAVPWSAIDKTDIPVVDPGTDTDGDGVIDSEDDYPTDPERAFDNYTPGPDTWGSLVYEDLWPAYGDYDLNDMVVDYRINQVTNAQNNVKDINCTWRLKAVGASYNNGFAFELPFAASNIQTVTSNHNLWTLESNGPKAVVRAFNNTFDLIPQVPGHFINTEIGQPYHTPVEVTTNITLINPVDANDFNNMAPYNPFIFVRGVRSHEVHLKNYEPTSQMDMALFGTANDDSNPAAGRYYVSKDNLPWALNIANEFEYPVERTMVTHAYLKFAAWSQSSGNSYPDWYMNNPGYRDTQYIYQH